MHRRFLMALFSFVIFSNTVCLAQPAIKMPPPQLVPPHVGGVRINTDGLIANWYPPRKRKTGTIVLLGGSEGGLGSGSARQADDLVSHGFAVLHLAYFGAPGLGTKLDMVPIEYFDSAFAWLKQQPGVDAMRIGIMGASKGAEAALLIASRHPELKVAVVGAPSAAIWPGIDFSGGPTSSSWSLGGKPLPFLRYGDAATSIFTGYQSGLATLPEHVDAAIPVALIKARVLLICGQADTLWPSCSMSQIVARKMGDKAKILTYPDAGHAVFGPPVSVTSPSYASLGSLGGSAAGNDAARSAAWPQIVAFLHAALMDK